MPNLEVRENINGLSSCPPLEISRKVVSISKKEITKNTINKSKVFLFNIRPPRN